jgi:hypothetical protein
MISWNPIDLIGAEETPGKQSGKCAKERNKIKFNSIILPRKEVSDSLCMDQFKT